MRLRLCLILVVGGFATGGCEVPLAPEPPAPPKFSNSYDPSFGGSKRDHIPNTPGRVRIERSDLHALTLAWDDRSLPYRYGTRLDETTGRFAGGCRPDGERF